jgi:chaperone BCS1
MGNCNSSQAEEMFQNFFNDATEPDVEKIGNFFQKLDSKSPVSPAIFENYLAQFKSSAIEAIDNICVLEEMIESEYKRRYSGKTIVYRYSAVEKKWCVFGNPRPKRPWASVVTQDDIKERLLEDVQRFQLKEKYYHDHGMPYRCGYLLHGPPGTGKSSLAYSLAGKLDYGICVVNFADKEMTDGELMRQLASVPTKCIVLVEDIDVALPSEKRKQDIDTEKSKGKELVKPNLSLSGILNAIDGVESVESQIMVMTTNFKEHLDPALIRPGR